MARSGNEGSDEQWRAGDAVQSRQAEAEADADTEDESSQAGDTPMAGRGRDPLVQPAEGQAGERAAMGERVEAGVWR